MAATAGAGVTISGLLGPIETVDDQAVFLLSAESDQGAIRGFDFFGAPDDPTDRGIFGDLSQINPFGLITVFGGNNGVIEGTGMVVELDSQFLFNGPGQESVTTPVGFSAESATYLGATFVAAEPLGASVPFARVVVPLGAPFELRGVVVLEDFTEVEVSASTPTLEPHLPEPAIGAMLALSAILCPRLGRRGILLG